MRTPLGMASWAMKNIAASVLEAETLARLCLMSHKQQVSVCSVKCLLLSKHCGFAALVRSALTEDERM